MRSDEPSSDWQSMSEFEEARTYSGGLREAGQLRLGAPRLRRIDVPRYSADTIDDMQKLLLGYRDNMRVEIEAGVAVTAKTVADLRALTTWPDGLVLNIHTDLDPRFSVVKVGRAA
jgi:hypothetical protein